MPTSDGHKLLPWFVLAYAPFFLNDFLLIRVTRWQEFMLVDVGTRLLVLLLLTAPPALRSVALRAEPRTTPLIPTMFVIAACIVLDRALNVTLGEFLELAFGHSRQFTFPEIPKGVKQLDLILGMLLVAITEELLCRRCAKIVLRPYLPSDAWLVVVSSVLFGAMHWSHGVGAVIFVSLIGVVLMHAYLRVGTIWPLVVAHYLIDVIAFW